MKRRKLSPEYNLQVTNPKLAKDWHPTKNGKLNPNNVNSGSRKKVWWKCPKGDDHVWEARVDSRTSGGGCPICSNRLAVYSNCLATINPDLAHEWHPSKNGNLTPNDVTPGSHKKVWWKCPKGDDHEWQAFIKDRSGGNGCAICASKIVVKSNCLATVNPELAKEWHPTKNSSLTPRDVTTGSKKKVWWKCPEADDHEWESTISDRNRGNGCPFCSNKAVTKLNCLATLSPELAKEWHPTKNRNLTSYDVTPGSNENVWWKCPKGNDHEWKTSISHRSSGTGCPMCANQIVVKSNCLGTLNPELAKEWHPTKNGNLTPDYVTAGSNKKVWWKCPKGDDHEWQASINDRNRGRGCPFCSNKRVTKLNCLAALNPELAKEWHPTKNGNLTPYDVTPGSNKKVWWKCPEGEDHEWQAQINSRTNGADCPFCSNKRVSKDNCLASLNPELAKEWHPILNGNLTPNDVTTTSTKKVWWKCPKGDDHEWETQIYSRQKGARCPVCANLKIVKSNCLATVDPTLAKEWHPTKNGNITPHDIGLGSGKTFWWACKKGHEWRTSLDHRKRGQGCPFCTNPSSTPELRIFCELKSIFPSIQHRVVLDSHEVDILIPDLKTGIEYDGEYWHRKKQKQDLMKNDALKDKILLIRVREKGLPLLADTDIELKGRGLSIATIKRILKIILNQRQIESPETIAKIHDYFKCTKWVAGGLFNEMHAARNHINIEESISHLFPELAKEWHPSKNSPLLPEYFTPGSNKKAWWKCPKGSDHEWRAPITSRVIGRGCPICSGRKTVESNCLATLNPELAKEWHPEKNGELTPNDIGPGSSKKVWWKCPKGDDHEWQASIASRNNGIGCPICSNRKAIASNCLATVNPKLAKEWHSTKNKDLTPYDITPGSHKKVWWKCPEGEDHEWQAQIKSRANGVGCPFCSNKRVSKDNCLATTNPALIKEWHPTKNKDLSPHDVTHGSGQKVWWKGKCGHEWQATINHRTGGKDCPKCSSYNRPIRIRKTKYISKDQLSF
jgi:hypothetical protein